jgi:CheY-like chemotaxis protein/two-component sensor histidine kinase
MRQDRQRNEFLAMLAHELRNPLAPIMAAADVLRLIGPSSSRAERQLEIIARQVRHLARLIDDLLDTSRITQGKIVLQQDALNLNGVIEQALQISAALIEEHGHHLIISLPPGGIWVQGDATRLIQVVCNLLNNAARYTNPGGQIWLTVEAAPTVGGASGTSMVEDAVIRVRDTGRGIPRELQSSIFDIFVQADRTLARSEGGLGVGLTLARSLVEQHSGTITLESGGTDCGSEFIVRLPLLANQRSRNVQSRPQVEGLGEGCRVLVIDDNVDVLTTLGDLLAAEGHQIWTASSGAEGIMLAQRECPDVILLDLGMPVMDGFAVARAIKENPQLDRVVLAALTGYGGSIDRRATHEAGFHYHLTKPVELNDLRCVLRKPGP